MPRLRLRSAVTGAAYKLELPNDCTWGALQDEARRMLGLASDADILLSLNKKTPLSGEPNDPLATTGICNGDLLWLLGPGVPEPPTNAGSVPAPTQSAPIASSVTSSTLASAQPPAPTTSTAAAANVSAAAGTCTAAASRCPATGEQQGPRPPAGAADSGSGSGVGGVAEAPTAATARGIEGGTGGGGGNGDDAMDLEIERDESELEALLGPPGVSLKLRRLMGVLPPSPPSAAATAGSTAAACRTSTLSYHPWSVLSAASRCLLLLDCALGDAGFEGLQDLPSLASAAPTTHLPGQLLYGCSYLRGCSNNSHDTAAPVPPPPAQRSDLAESATAVATARAVAAAGHEDCGGGGDGSGSAAAKPDVIMAEATGRAEPVDMARPTTSSTGFSSATGSTSTTAAAAAVKLVWYNMGRFLVVHGMPCAATVAAGGVMTMHIDLSEYGSDLGGTAVGATAEESLQPPLQQPRLLPQGLPAHWRRLKDCFVLPLLAAACRTAGVPPPLGLTVLPLELQLMVLRQLEARDLAALSCVSTSLHHLASEDELWRPLYDKEFGSGPSAAADAMFASVRGFKSLYGRRWRERAERRKRRQPFLAVPPAWGPPPVLPRFRPPFMPPGSIGGDYDRLPGPLLGPGGGGPAFFSGGGRLPGGPGGPVFFGGGGFGTGPGLPGGLQGPPGTGAGRRPGVWGGGFGGGGLI